MKGTSWCEIKLILWQDKKNLNIKKFSLPFGFHSPFYCASCICLMHRPDLPHQQKYLLNHKEQHSPSISKTTPSKITFLLDLVRDHMTYHDDP